MRVTVHVYDQIKAAVGRGRLDVELPAGSTLGALFGRLAAEVDPRFSHLPNDENSPFGVNLLVLDGRRLTLPRDEAAVLADGAELHLIPPIGGG